MKRFTGYVLTLVAVLIIATAALGPPKALKARSKGKGGASSGENVPRIKKVLCQVVQGMAGNPSSEAIALCGDLLFKTVFVTSTVHNGDLKTAGGGATGLEGADNICNLRAHMAGLPGTYTAWLSDSSTDAKDRITQSAIPYVRTDGVWVADNFADLTNCGNPFCLQAPIDRVANGGVPGGVTSVWTHTDPPGTHRDGFNFVDWTDSHFSYDSILGFLTDSHETWTVGGIADCDHFLHLYCFQD